MTTVTIFSLHPGDHPSWHSSIGSLFMALEAPSTLFQLELVPGLKPLNNFWAILPLSSSPIQHLPLTCLFFFSFQLIETQIFSLACRNPEIKAYVSQTPLQLVAADQVLDASGCYMELPERPLKESGFI